MAKLSSFALQFSNGDAASLLASSHDLLILEGDPLDINAPSPTVSDVVVAQLRAQGRTVVGYVNLAVTDANRPYWQGNWTTNEPNGPAEDDKNPLTADAPNWLKGQQQNGFGVVVKFWDQDWRSIVISQAINLVSRGYDGVFLDDALAYYSYGTDDPAMGTIAQRARAMLELVVAVNAAITLINPNAYVVVNGATYILGDAMLSPLDPLTLQYLDVVDAVLLENYSNQTDYDRAVTTFAGHADLLAVKTNLSDPAAISAFGQSMYGKGILPHAVPGGSYDLLGISPEPGTSGNDVISGGNGPNLLRGFAGNDTIAGFFGNDRLDGGADNDVLAGDSGNDSLAGGSGTNTLSGNGGMDTAIYTFASSAATITKSGNSWSISSAANGVTDTLLSLEKATFTDKTITLREGALTDLNGNGTTDMVLQNGGSVVAWNIASNVAVSGTFIGLGVSGWNVVGSGDFDGDGDGDVMLQQGGTIVTWSMQDGVNVGGTLIGTGLTGWNVVATGDVDNDNDADVVLQNGSSVVAWTMQNGVHVGSLLVGAGVSGWTVVGVGDFYRDGSSDVLLQNGGTVVVWNMKDGVNIGGAVMGAGISGWTVKGVGDVNGDGTSDVILQNGGVVVDWIVQNGFATTGNVLGVGVTGWAVVSVGDYDGDGDADVTLQNGGTLVEWQMQNGLNVGGVVIGAGIAGWSVVA